MENELENLSKQELIQQLLTLKKSNQQLEFSITKKDDSIARLSLTLANLRRMLFGSKRERFIVKDKQQLQLLFEEFASQEAIADETPVKQTITYERKKNSNHAGRNKLPKDLPVV